MPIPMHIGHLILMIGGLHLELLFFLDLIWSLGGPGNSQWLPVLLQRQNIGAWLSEQLISLGFSPFFLKSRSSHHSCHSLWQYQYCSLAHNPVLHSRTKHTELDLFFVREKVLTNQINVVHVPALNQLADILTKVLCPATFLFFFDQQR